MAYGTMDAAEHLARYAMLRPICAGKRVLDVACGEGYGSYLLAQWGAASVTGVDISTEAIANARAIFPAANVTYLEGDVCRLGEVVPANSRFDLICSFETIEHLADPNAFLASLAAVKTADGVIAISAPNDQILAEGVNNPYHLQRFDLKSLKALTEAALGSASAWLLGAPFQGYLLAPERGLETPAEEEDMRRGLRLKSHGALDLIPPQRGNAPLEGNVHFWVGLWGAPSLYAAVGAPQSMTSWLEPWRALDYFKQREADWKERLAQFHGLEIKLAEERRLGQVARTQLDQGSKLNDQTIRAVAREVWRERRRRRLTSKIWRLLKRRRP